MISSFDTTAIFQAPKQKQKKSLDIQFIITASQGREQWENLEQNINEWLDEQNITMVDPFQKQQEYYQTQKNVAIEELIRDDSRLSISPVTPPLQELTLGSKSNSLLQRRAKFSFDQCF